MTCMQRRFQGHLDGVYAECCPVERGAFHVGTCRVGTVVRGGASWRMGADLQSSQ